MIEPGSIVLTKKERPSAIKLLGLLQTHLESAIEGCTMSGEFNGDPDPAKPDFVESVRIDRRDWRAAEDLIMKLSIARAKGASR